MTNPDTFTNAQFRAWKHPQTGKWRVIGWDGDWLRFRYGGMHYHEASDQFLSSNPNATVYEDLKLHGSLKQRAEYLVPFAARPASRLKASSTGGVALRFPSPRPLPALHPRRTAVCWRV